jgi:hypothetical protein
MAELYSKVIFFTYFFVKLLYLNWLFMFSLSLFRCLCHQNDTMRRLTLKLTGATGTLIFYSILPGKTLKVEPNKAKKALCACSGKSTDVELPSHIINSAKVVFDDQGPQSSILTSEFSLESCDRKARNGSDTPTVRG